MMGSTGYPSGTQVEVEYLGDDLPPIVGADERQEVREELRADRTFGARVRARRMFDRPEVLHGLPDAHPHRRSVADHLQGIPLRPAFLTDNRSIPSSSTREM